MIEAFQILSKNDGVVFIGDTEYNTTMTAFLSENTEWHLHEDEDGEWSIYREIESAIDPRAAMFSTVLHDYESESHIFTGPRPPRRPW